jgi:hypothetical protein
MLILMVCLIVEFEVECLAKYCFIWIAVIVIIIIIIILLILVIVWLSI